MRRAESIVKPGQEHGGGGGGSSRGSSKEGWAKWDPKRVFFLLRREESHRDSLCPSQNHGPCSEVSGPTFGICLLKISRQSADPLPWCRWEAQTTHASAACSRLRLPHQTPTSKHCETLSQWSLPGSQAIFRPAAESVLFLQKDSLC